MAGDRHDHAVCDDLVDRQTGAVHDADIGEVAVTCAALQNLDHALLGAAGKQLLERHTRQGANETDPLVTYVLQPIVMLELEYQVRNCRDRR